MIRVVCGACDASFQARDELAGRRGKCPSCGKPITVPEAGDEAIDEEADEPAAVLGAHGGRSRAGASRRSAGSSRRRSPAARKRSSGALPMVLIVLAVAAAIASYFALQEGKGVNPYGVGLELLSRAEYARAMVEFEKLKPGDRLYADAQEKRTEALELQETKKALASTRFGSLLYNIIIAQEKHYVSRGGEGHFHVDYVPNTRYLLKRCRDFLQTYPDDARATEVKGIVRRYEHIVSLDDPPTEADLRVELKIRMMGKSPNYMLAVELIDEFAALSPDNAAVVRELRDEVQAHTARYWLDLKDELERTNALAPGQENWQKVANQCALYFARLEGVPGLTPVAEAQLLLEKATRGGG